MWCLLPSATAISNSRANSPPSTIHHQSRCCKIALRLSLACGTAEGLVSEGALTLHTFTASEFSAYTNSDSFGEGFTLKIFSTFDASSYVRLYKPGLSGIRTCALP